MGLQSHINSIMNINASIGMLYSYDSGWSGTFTGAYAGSGEIRLSRGEYIFEYDYADGSSSIGSLKGGLLKCDTYNTEATQIHHIEAAYIENKDDWFSIYVSGNKCSLLSISSDGTLTYIQGSAEDFSGYDITLGSTIIEDLTHDRLLYKNGEVVISP